MTGLQLERLPLLTDLERRAWTQPEKLTVSEWADRHRVLDPMFSAEAGPWNTDRVPHAREWMDSAVLPWVRRLTLMASTQVAKSETLNNILGFHIHQDPCPMMLVVPRADDAKLAANRRVLPMVEASSALQAERTERMHDIKAREMVFRRCILYFRAAQSPADLASVPVRVVVADECDKWPQWTGREAAPLNLVMERMRTFPDSLLALCSTPTTRNGLIFREFEDGDQRRFHVPCPHCRRFQVLRFPQVKWDSQAVSTAKEMRRQRQAWYECEHCKGRIDDRQKRLMLAAGVWVPEARTLEEWLGGAREQDRHEHRSYHVWAGYSPWIAWWQIAAEFLRSKDDASQMQNFVNSWLAELWEEQVEGVTDAAVVACIDQEHKQGEVPADVKVLTAAVDVQKDRLEWLVMGWGLDEESWTIAAGRVATWHELGDLLFRNTWGKQELAIRGCAIDSRHRRDEVLDFVRRWQPVARMIAGVEREGPVPFATVKIDKHPRTGVALPNSTTVWTVNVGWFKDLVNARLLRAQQADQSRAGRLHLAGDLPPEWLRQVASEHKVRERSGGRERLRWILRPGHQRNEAWDLLVYNAAVARLIRVDTLRSADSTAGAPTVRRRPAPPPAGHSRGKRGGVSFPRLGGGG